MDNELVSVIVPVYGVEMYIAECLESIIHQTYTNLEIIVVDDGTRDRSGEIAEEYAQKDSRITVIHQENQGLPGARNTGLRNSHGKYIQFVDSDDYLDTTMIEKMHKALVEHNAQMSVCYETAFEEQEVPKKTIPPISKICVEDHHQYMLHYLDRFRGHIGFVWNKLYTRELLEDKFFTDGYYFEDIAYNATLSNRVNCVVWLPEELYYYRQHGGSIMHNKFDKRAKDYVHVLQKECEIFQREEPDEKFLVRHSTRILSEVHLYYKMARKGKQKTAVEYLQHAFCEMFDEVKWKDISCFKRIKYRLIYYRIQFKM